MEIIIPVNKRRFPVQLFVCSLIAVAISVYFFYAGTFSLDPFSPMSVLVVLLIIDIRYVILLAKVYAKTQFDRSAGFTITDSGIIDNMTVLGLGKIPWEEIDDIGLDRYRGKDILLVGIVDPDKYLKRLRPIYRSILRGYIKKWNTPLIISERRVDYDMENLRDLLLNHSTSTINSHDLRNVR
jgi:hypothetical protein